MERPDAYDAGDVELGRGMAGWQGQKLGAGIGAAADDLEQHQSMFWYADCGTGAARLGQQKVTRRTVVSYLTGSHCGKLRISSTRRKAAELRTASARGFACQRVRSKA